MDCKKAATVINFSEDENSIKKRTLWELIRISTSVAGIEFTYSGITSFVNPLLSEMGVDYGQMALVWCFSPFIGLFLTPILGSMSDQCTWKMGRRRPFIIILGILNMIGLLLIPFGEIVSTIVPNNSIYFYITLLCTIFGVIMADYTSDALQSPCRTYMMDVCIPEDQARGLTTLTIMGGMGGFFGYLLGTVNWESIANFANVGLEDNAFNGEVHVLFTLTTILFAICIIVSITTVKENPLPVLQEVENVNALNINSNIMTVITNDNDKTQQSAAKVSEKLPISSALVGIAIEYLGISYFDASVSGEQIQLRQYYNVINNLPFSLKILCLTNLFGLIAHTSYTLYFTDFVGTVIFEGISTACDNSTERINYETGVKYGCMGMSLFSLSCTLYSIALKALVKVTSLKFLYMCGILSYSISILLMVLVPSKISCLILSCGCGISYATMFTIPYILIAQYHNANVFEVDGSECSIREKNVRGKGTDVALLSSTIFMAQFLLSILAMIVMAFIENSFVILLIGSFFAFVSFICASRVLYL